MTTGRDRITLYEYYKVGDVSEEATRLLLGDAFEFLEADVEEFAAAADEDTRQYLV